MIRHSLSAVSRWLVPVALLASVAGFAVPAAADSGSDWLPGPDSILTPTYAGFVDAPTAGATLAANQPIQVSGWVVDTTAQGWAGFDDLNVYDGVAGQGGTMVARGMVAQPRPDVAAAFSNGYWLNSGFLATIPANTLGAGQHTLSIYAHTAGKGWWYKQVTVNVGAATAPSTQPSTAPTTANVGGGPTLVVETPKAGGNIYTGFTSDYTYTMRGYAFNPSASFSQGSQGSGIDKVQLYLDDNYWADADLGFSDQLAQDAGGSRFANSGWQYTFKPTTLHAEYHQLEVRAHDVVTNKWYSTNLTFQIVEGRDPNA